MVGASGTGNKYSNKPLPVKFNSLQRKCKSIILKEQRKKAKKRWAAEEKKRQ